MCTMCCCVETIYRRVLFIKCTSKDKERNILSDGITFVSLLKTSDLQ